MSTIAGINIGAVERELAAIWREEAAGDASHEERAVTRARVLTLIVYGDKKDYSSDFDEIIADISNMHPARAIVLQPDRSGTGNGATSHVTAVCRVQGPRSKQVTCEQDTFAAQGEAIHDLPSGVAQLLAPDTPVFVWLLGIPEPGDYVFNHLLPMADRVILDSSSSTHPGSDLVKLAATFRDHPHWTSLTDFTWQRLTPWREMLANFYDGMDHRPYLDRVDTVTIEFNPHEGVPGITPRSMLLSAWLAERLGWTIDTDASRQDGDTSVFTFSSPKGPVTIRFVPVVHEAMDGLLASITLTASTAPNAEFTVRRVTRSRLSSVIVLEGRQHASRVLAYRSRTVGELLSTELGIQRRDVLYEAALAVAGQMGEVDEG
jgi:glucose-6-phosphate dehydrogenase assembly protein OpcA